MHRAGRHHVSFASVKQRSKCIRPSQRSSARTATATIHAELGMFVRKVVRTFNAISVERVRLAQHDAHRPSQSSRKAKKKHSCQKCLTGGTLSDHFRSGCNRLARCFAPVKKRTQKWQTQLLPVASPILQEVNLLALVTIVH